MIKQIQEINFPSYATLSSATVTLNDMGDRTISTQVKISGDIIPDFSYDWEIEFQGERYIQPLREPQASKGNESLSSRIDLVFYHKTIWQLKRYYFVEMTSTESGTVIVSEYIAPLGLNLSDFCVAFQKVLDHYFDGEITIDLNPDWEYANAPSLISISYLYIWDVLQKMYKVYGVRWSIEGKTIKVGYPSVELSHIFQYGYEGGLLKVERQVQDTNIRNSLLGRGGEKNLPAYYFKESPEGSLFASDPDAIPELANIYFSNLRGSTFRDYVRGWKAKHYGGTPMNEPTEAYTKGYTDAKFSPIEYVEDKESIAKYGLLQGALDNNEEIYPSIQGAPNGEDVVVYVEPVTNDDFNSSIETESIIENLDPASVTVEVERYSTYQDRIFLYDIEVKGGGSVTYIPSYRVVGYVEDTDIENVSLVLGELAFINPTTNTTYIDLSNIPEGNYIVEFRYAIRNNGSNDVSVTVAVEQIKLKTISIDQVSTDAWKPTFDIWVKNIWGSTRAEEESDEAYAERVWRPILGDRQGNEAKVVFSSGWLSGHNDYEFTIVDFAYDNSHEYNGVQSEWRLTLNKSDAELKTTGKYIPSASTNGQAYAGDTFFFLGIDMPYQYVLWAEERLDNYKYIALNEVCDIQPKWVVKFDKVRLNKSEDNLAEQIVVGGIINLADIRFINSPSLKLYLQSITYTWNEQTLLHPDIEVVLGDKITPIQNPVAQLQGSIDIINSQLSSIGGIGNLPQLVKTIGSSMFLRKDGISDTSKSHTKFANIVSGHNFRQGIVGGSDWGIYRDALGRSVAEFDKLVVRNDMFVNNLVINQVSSIGGEQIASAAAMVCSRVVKNDNGYICYFDQKEGTIGNLFQVNDIAYSQVFDTQNATTKYYKRVVKAIGVDYILLSDNEGEKDDEGVPIAGDNIIQMGNTTNINRQSVIIISPLNGGSITLYNGINSFSLENKNYVGYGVNPSTQRAYLYGYGDMFFGDRELKSDFITYQIPEGSDKPKLVVNATVEFGSDSTGLSNLSDFQGLAQDIEDTQTEVNNIKGGLDNVQDYIDIALQEELDEIRAQVDGQVQSYYFDYDPTLTNYPASEWTTDALKEAHIGDTFTNTQEYIDDATTPNAGKSWRWLNKDGVYGWYVIADSDATKALLMAQDALDLADGKRRVFVVEPYPPYDIGDLWADGADLKRCIKSRETGEYVAGDWDLATNYTDDTVANEALETANRAVTLVDVFYASSDSATTYPPKTDTNAWDTTPPTWVDGKYIWSYTKTIYANATYAETDPVNITGAIGATGAGISQIVEQYAITDSPTVLPSESAWSTNRPEWVNGKYIWTRSVIYYTDGREPYTTQPICVTGERGHDGADAESNYVLDLSNQMATVACDAQGNVIGTLPTTTAKVFYGTTLETDWNFVHQEENCDATLTQSNGVATITVTSLSANDASVQIAASKAGAPILNVTFNITKVLQGVKGGKGDTGAAAVIYSIEPSVDKVTRDRDVITPSLITVTQYKTTGNTARTITAEKTIKYQRNGKDGSVQSAGNVETCNIEIDSKSITSVDIYLYDGGTLLDKERVPVLADANALDEIRLTTDKEYSIWFSDVAGFIPTNNNAPAEDWTTEEIKDSHEEDILYNSVDGLAWRYEGGEWVEITDAQTVRALELINEVSNNADAKNNSLANAWGYKDYDSMIAAATLNGKTLITNGYINTELIQTNSLIAKKVAVSDDGVNIFIDSTNKFAIQKDDGSKVLTLNENGLTLFDSGNNNKTAQLSGVDIISASSLIPHTQNYVLLREKIWNYRDANGTFTLLEYQNNSGVEQTLLIPALYINIEASAQYEVDYPSGNINASLAVGNTTHSLNMNLGEESWRNEVNDNWEDIYYGDNEEHFSIPANSIVVSAGQTISIKVTISSDVLTNATATVSIRANDNSNSSVEKEYKVPIFYTQAVSKDMSFSDYYGNGFILARSAEHYVAASVTEDLTQFIVRASNNMLRFTNGGLEISDDAGASWNNIWDKLMNL